MTFLEQFRKAGISDVDIISTFQFKSGGSGITGNRSFKLGDFENPECYSCELFFNKKGKLYDIKPGTLLAKPKAQLEFVNRALEDINGDHGYMISHRILFSKKPLKGKFQWKDDFRIKPCLNNSKIGKGLAWGIENHHQKNDLEKHLGPPYPFILEVRTKKSPNSLIETNRYLEALDFYQWLLSLLIPHLLGSPENGTSQPKWIMLQKNNMIEYHLAYEGFGAHESEIETGENFSFLNIPDVPRYSGYEGYYNNLWIRNTEIELPAEMEHYLMRVDKLSFEDKENFRRSLYWFNTGLVLYNRDQLSIIPFAISIECLLPNPSEVCPTCNRTRGDGSTKLFNEFLEKHLSLPESIEHLREAIYSQRSIMAHGKFSISADKGYFSIMASDVSELASENFTRRSLVNWLVRGLSNEEKIQ